MLFVKYHIICFFRCPMLKQKELEQIKEELDNCQNPMFLFGDDQDALCSFIMLYQYKKEGRGIVVKGNSSINKFFSNKVNEYGSDKVFVLDMPKIQDDFMQNVNVPIIWIDHHGYEEIFDNKVKYFNPKKYDKNCYIPTSQIVYDVLKENSEKNKERMWLAVIGIIGDFAIPPFLDEFCKEYPYLLEKPLTDPGKIKYETELGKLTLMFNFFLKGATTNVNQNIKILSRITDPKEIIENSTSRAKFLNKHYLKHYKEYEEYLIKAKKEKPKKNLYVFMYDNQKTSVTKDLANHLSYLYPKKLVIIARIKNENVILSLRWDKSMEKIVEEASLNLNARIGGHPNAMGGTVLQTDWEEFIKRVERLVN